MNIWLQLFIPLIVGVLVGCILRVVVLIMKDKGSSLAQTCIFSIMTPIFTLLWLRGFWNLMTRNVIFF